MMAQEKKVDLEKAKQEYIQQNSRLEQIENALKAEQKIFRQLHHWNVRCEVVRTFQSTQPLSATTPA